MSTCTRCLWLQIIVVTVQLLMLARQAALRQSDLPRAMWSNHSSAPRPAGESEGITPPPPPSPPPEAGAADGITGQTHVPPIAAEPAAGEPGQAPVDEGGAEPLPRRREVPSPNRQHVVEQQRLERADHRLLLR